jgi:hypothetical protein
MTLAILLIAAWMLGVAVIAVNERRSLADHPDLWVGSRLLWVLVLGWPVSLALFVAMGPFLEDDER